MRLIGLAVVLAVSIALAPVGANAQTARTPRIGFPGAGNVHHRQLIELAAKYRLPAIYEFKDYVQDGGLMSYGPDINPMFRRAASYVDRILKGAKPRDLPVERPSTFHLAINLKTAKVLGLTIPQSVLGRADHVLE